MSPDKFVLFQIEQWDNTHLWLIPFEEPSEKVMSHNDWVAAYKRWLVWCQLLPERTWRKGPDSKHLRGWVVPLTEVTLNIITGSYRENVDFTFSASAAMMVQYLKLSGAIDSKKAQKRWEYLFNNEGTEFNYPSPLKPMMHQRVAVEAMLDAEYFALLCEMGTGKTKMICDEIACYARRPELMREQILIVCPKSLRTGWQREIYTNVARCHHIHITLIDGVNDFPRMMQSGAAIQIGIISMDLLTNLTMALVLLKPSLLVFDEAQFFKSPDKNRFKAARKVSEVARRKRILTGTPMANTIMDYWAEYELLRPGILGYATYAGFKKAFAKVKNIIDPVTKQPTRFDKIEGYKDVDLLKQNISRCSFIVTKDRCLDLPPRSYDTRVVEMPENMRLLYNQMQDDFFLEMDGGRASTDFIIVQMLKLSEICSGFVKTTHTDPLTQKEYRKITPIPGADLKLNEMIEDAVAVCAEGKLLIWCRFHYDIDIISQKLGERGIKHIKFDGRAKDTKRSPRQALIDQFNNDPETRVGIMQVATGSVGLTLLGNTKVQAEKCLTSFFYNNTFNFAQRDQAEARNHRKGAEKDSPVLYRDYVYGESIEEAILSALLSKKNLAALMKDVTSIKDFLLKGQLPVDPEIDVSPDAFINAADDEEREDAEDEADDLVSHTERRIVTPTLATAEPAVQNAMDPNDLFLEAALESDL